MCAAASQHTSPVPICMGENRNHTKKALPDCWVPTVRSPPLLVLRNQESQESGNRTRSVCVFRMCASRFTLCAKSTTFSVPI